VFYEIYEKIYREFGLEFEETTEGVSQKVRHRLSIFHEKRIYTKRKKQNFEVKNKSQKI
jgi:hypothetical protein